MKIFLQDCKTAQFIRCDSAWTLDINEALNFLSARRAVSFGVKELKNSFQVVRIESNEVLGTIIMAISNLRWQNGSQSALSISVTSARPKPTAGRAPLQRGSSPPPRIIMLDGEREVRPPQALAGSGFPDDAIEEGTAIWDAHRLQSFDNWPEYAPTDRR